MAFTTEEESKLRTIMDAYDNGQQIDDLPLADSTVQDKEIEVFDKKTGASGRMAVSEAVSLANRPFFARVWNMANATSKAASWTGSLEFGQTIAEKLKLGGYLVKNDHSRRKLDPTNHYRFETGETAKLDGSMGHYQWGWGVPFYLAIWEAGGLHYEAVSLSPIRGQYNYRIPIGSICATGLACMERRTSTLVSYVNEGTDYRGGNNTSDWDGTYRSLLGKPVSNINTETARAAARKNGTGWLAGTMRHSAVVAILFSIIFGTHNVQETYASSKDSDGLYQGGFGMGVTEIPDWGGYNSYNPMIPTSAGIELGDSCGVSTYQVLNSDGSVRYNAPVPCFFGLKNFYGYLWRIMDDEFVKCNADTSVTHLVAPSIYGSWTCGVETGMVALSTSPTNISSYIKQLSYNHLELFPTVVGGSSSTYYADNFWNTSGSTSGFRLVLRGAYALDGSGAGAFTVFVNYAVSSAYAYIGSPLCEAAEEWPLDPEYAAVD